MKRKKPHEIEVLASIINDPNIHAHVELARRPRELTFSALKEIVYIKCVGWRKSVLCAATKIHVDTLPQLIQDFVCGSQPSHGLYTAITTQTIHSLVISAFSSASSIFFAPSDPSGITGMRREHIRANPCWRKGPPRYDTIFLKHSGLPSMHGMQVACVRLFFTITLDGIRHSCALVHMFKIRGTCPDPAMRMWVVEPALRDHGEPVLTIVPLTKIICAAHLLPIFGADPVPKVITCSDTLNVFEAYYVNCYIDHHAFEILS
jgi:hypothetical protein